MEFLPNGQPNPVFQEYNRDDIPSYKFGAFSFNDVVLDFKPHIVMSWRDMWMDSHIPASDLRPYFKWLFMAPCDSAPQLDDWIPNIIDADLVYTYSDWAQDVLKKQCGNKIRLMESTPPCATSNCFKVIPNKKQHKKNLGLPEDCLIIGTVMRNQKRKLYPDLFEAFRDYLNKCDPNIAKKTYLYLHTSYPDLGWELPKLMKEYGILNRCLFSYVCKQCSVVYPSVYHEAVGVCKNCQQVSAILPRTERGISTATLSDIYNLFDVYVQYSIAEGFGIPIVEAAACGVPVMVVNYSAMEDFPRTLKAFPIPVQRFFLECETQAYRAYPDNNAFVSELLKFFNLSENTRMERSRSTYISYLKNYDWDKVARTWMDGIDSIDVEEVENKWLSPPDIYEPQNITVPDNVTNTEFIRWAIMNVLRQPEKLNSYMMLKLSRDLNYGVRPLAKGGIYFNDSTLVGQRAYINWTRENQIQEFVNMRQGKNFWERVRTRQIPKDMADAVRFKKPEVNNIRNI